MRKLTNNLTLEERKNILNEPNGVRKLLSLNEDVLIELNKQIDALKMEIRSIEGTAASWINLTIVLAVFQILPLEKSETVSFVLICLPSFIILIYSTALTLLKSPSNSKPDFVVPEKSDLELKLKITDAEIQALTFIYQFLDKSYNRKTFWKKLIGPSVVTNFTISIVFIILKTFSPELLILNLSIVFGVLSIIGIILLSRFLSISKTFRYSGPLNE